MTAPIVIGTAVMVCGVGLTAAARLWPTAPRSHRAPSAATVPATVDEDQAPELPPDINLAALLADGEADATDYDHCPREQRTQPHAFRVDGTKCCWNCGHETAGNQ
ncbi:hypothetical protein AB4212_03915 [Streptomyces sp. 2MCAF27]